MQGNSEASNLLPFLSLPKYPETTEFYLIQALQLEALQRLFLQKHQVWYQCLTYSAEWPGL